MKKSPTRSVTCQRMDVNDDAFHDMIIVGVKLLLCIADFCGRHLRNRQRAHDSSYSVECVQHTDAQRHAIHFDTMLPILTSCGLSDMLNLLQANSGDAKFNSFEVALKLGIAEYRSDNYGTKNYERDGFALTLLNAIGCAEAWISAWHIASEEHRQTITETMKSMATTIGVSQVFDRDLAFLGHAQRVGDIREDVDRLCAHLLRRACSHQSVMVADKIKLALDEVLDTNF